MNTVVTIQDNIYARAEGSISDIDNLLKYKMPGYMFTPSGKRGWDGWITMTQNMGMATLFPAGLVDYVMKQPFASKWTVIDERTAPMFKPLYSDVELGELEPHQLDCVEKAIASKRGVIQYPTGVGKGRIIGGVIRRLGVKTLVIVDKIDLVRQLGDEIEGCLGVPVGRIGGGLWDEKDCTVATFQTISKHIVNGRGGIEWWQQWEAVCNDEGHHTEAKTFAQCLQALTEAYYRFSFSATPFKSTEGKLHDPTYLKVQAWTGPAIATMSLSAGVDTGRIVPADVFILKPPSLNIGFQHTAYDTSPGKPPEMYWTCTLHGKKPTCSCPINFQEEYEARTINNVERNELIVKLARRLRQAGPTVVLVQRLEQGQILADGIGCPFLSGTTKGRAEMYEAFKRGEEKCLVISSIADEGLDLPNIEYLILAGGGKADHRQIQRLGRGMRASSNKTSLTAFDFVDEGKHTAQHYKQRRRLYEREPAYTVIDLSIEDLKKWGVA